MNVDSNFIRYANLDDKDSWDAYVDTNKNGLAYHYFAWKSAVEESYGFECPYFIAMSDGKVLGVFPTVHIRKPLGKGKLVSLPYCDVGGILAETEEIAEALFKYACVYAINRKIKGMEVRHGPEFSLLEESDSSKMRAINPSAWDENTPVSGKVRMMLELPGSSETLLSSFKSKLRSQIKKPVRDGLTARLGGEELLDAFYSVFAENMRALGSPVHSKAWIASVLRHFGDKSKCGVVFMPDSTPAAGGIILFHNDTVSIPWASSLQCFNRFNPNMILYWSFLQYAADHGYRYFDFGRSTPGEGTYRFKAQWGANPQNLEWEEWRAGKNGFSPVNKAKMQNTAGPGRRMAEGVIRKMPTPTATFLGSRLRKYITL